jgi:hypothetical protein
VVDAGSCAEGAEAAEEAENAQDPEDGGILRMQDTRMNYGG